MFVNTAVLGLGDPKFEGLWGGFPLYFLVWFLFSLPLTVTAVVVAGIGRMRSHPARRRLFLWGCLTLILASVEVAFLMDTKWQLLTLEHLAMAIIFVVVGRLISPTPTRRGTNADTPLSPEA